MDILNSYPVKNNQVIGRVVDGEAVLVLPSKGEVKVLNEVAARIWELSDGTESIGAIASVICEEYQVNQAQAEADVIEFLGVLTEKGILHLSEFPNGEQD